MNLDKVLTQLDTNCKNSHTQIQKDILEELYVLRTLMKEESANQGAPVIKEGNNLFIILFFLLFKASLHFLFRK